MNPFQAAVAVFHRETGSTIGAYPAIRDRELRAKLIMEEAVETVAALGFAVSATIDEAGIAGLRPIREIGRFSKTFTHPDIVETIDGLCDLTYVTLGTAVAMGIDLDPYFAEVHRSNMDKLHGPKRADGKQLKPTGWQPPRILQLLTQEGA